jgi:solute carrier family 25 (peroxisomal adenine nucleotide transporter), member 17
MPLFSEKSLIQALSAAFGSIASGTLFYPLNIVRLTLQVRSRREEGAEDSVVQVLMGIVRRQGVAGLFRGWSANTFTVAVSSFLYFYLHNALKIVYSRRRGGVDAYLSPLVHICIASVAAAVNVLLTTPLWVATTKLSIQTANEPALPNQVITGGFLKDKNPQDVSPDSVLPPPDTTCQRSLFTTLQGIYIAGGLNALWAGVVPSLCLISNPAIQTVTYEKLLAYWEQHGILGNHISTPIEIFIIAAFAKAVATVVTYPLQVIQSNLQVGEDKPFKEGSSSPHLRAIVERILHERGIGGLFAGLGAKMWQTVLNSAFMFMTYETLQRFITFVVTNRRQRVIGVGSGQRNRKYPTTIILYT